MKRKKQIESLKKLRAGNNRAARLLVVVRGERVIVLAKRKALHKAIRGIGKGLYGDGYLTRERKSWD